MSNKWKQTRHDLYYKLAKEQGFRSRAAFKLIQINKKYDFLGSCKAVLDLCAAPGGWLQVARKFMPVSSLLVGVDLFPIKSIPGVITLEEDITTESCRIAIQRELKTWQVDCVLHDGAPNVGGSTWAKDAYGQNELVIYSLRLSTRFLRAGGWFITKVFRSQDYNALIWVLNQFFKKCEVCKPAASRAASAEIFIVCRGYLAPRKIAPELLDPNVVFKNYEAGVNKVDVFKKKAKRNRSGYDEDNMTQFTKLSVAKFIESTTPIELLGEYSMFEFDEASKMYAEHPSTNFEMKELCKDLKVLGKGDFSALLKWRVKLKDYRDELMVDKEEADDEDEAEPEEQALTAAQKEDVHDASLNKQLHELTKKVAAKRKKELRKKKGKLNKQRSKQRALNVNSTDMAELLDSQENLGLFKMGIIKDQSALTDVHTAGTAEAGEVDLFEGLSDSDEYGGEFDDEDDDDEVLDSDQEAEKRLKAMEAGIDQDYEQYKARRNMTNKKRKKLGLQEENDSLQEVLDAANDDDSDNEDAESDEDAHALHMPIVEQEEVSAKQKAARWFERDLFQDLDAPVASSSKKSHASLDDIFSDDDDEGDAADDEEERDEPAREKPKPKKKKKKSKQKGKKKGKDTNKNEEDEAMEEGVSENEAESGAAKKNKKKQKKKQKSNKKSEAEERDTLEQGLGKGKMKKEKKAEDEMFEEVPLSDYSSDSDAQAEIMAMGTMMLRKRKKQEMIDDGYNRHAWGDEELPEWFQDYEERNNKRPIPVTKQMVMMFKEQQRAINARPIKKVMEAKARKKQKALKRWEKAKQKAGQIAEGDEDPGTKAKMIQAIYAKNAQQLNKQKKTTFLVSKKGGGNKTAGQGGKGSNTMKVDRRMKADTRGEKASAKRGKKKGGKRNSSSKRRKR